MWRLIYLHEGPVNSQLWSMWRVCLATYFVVAADDDDQ